MANNTSKPVAIISIYADLIKAGEKTIEEVPEKIREDVRQALLDSSNN